jgi:hypothetical protein
MASGAKGQNGGQSGDRKGDAARAARLGRRCGKTSSAAGAGQRTGAGRTEDGQDSSQAAPHDSAGFVPDKSKD